MEKGKPVAPKQRQMTQAEKRLAMAEICTRYLAKGTNEQVAIFSMYIDLGIKALQEHARKNKELQDATNAKLVADLKLAEEAKKNKEAKPKVKPKAVDKSKVVKSVKNKEVVVKNGKAEIKEKKDK